MQNFTGRNYLVLIVCALLMLSACGQKGDLYLPEGQAYTVEVG